MKKVLKLFGILILLGIVALTVLWFYGAKEREDAMALVVNDVDFSTLEDGTYYGYYEGGIHEYRENAVQVTIEDGKIVSILNVLNNEDKTEEFLDELYGRVIDAQSLEIDAIATATLTTKAYLKSIEDALTPEPTD